MTSRSLFAALGLIAGLIETLPARAHDFWVQPEAYWVTPAAGTPLTLLVGHGPQRQRSPIPSSRITRFEAVGLHGLGVDLRPLLRLRGRADDGTVTLDEPGAYVLVLQTDARARCLLPAIRFNDYLRVEGLTPALAFRERTHRMGADGSEAYSRQAKTILQVGTHTDAQPQVTRALGLLLEIVLDVDPYAEPLAGKLPVHVIYKGLRLPGALVKLTNLEHDSEPVETHITDRAGRATFSARRNGDWLLNVIWTEVAPPSSDADFETTFSSLSFGFAGSSRLRSP